MNRGKKFVKVLFLLLVLSILFSSLSQVVFAEETIPINRLISNMKEYDGKEVTIEGEVVGDIMIRGQSAWITVNDDPYSRISLEEGGSFKGLSNIGIGVWAQKEQVDDIKVLGGYKNKGDIVIVRGVFHRACHEHGGDTDIHAISIEVRKQGYPFRHPIQWWKLLLAISFSLVSALLWAKLRMKKKAAISSSGKGA